MANSAYTQLYNDQVTLNTKYSEYTVAYIKYIDCSLNNVTNPANRETCTQPNIDELSTAINNVSIRINDITSTSFSQDNIDSSYNNLVSMRNDLDSKLQHLYNLQNASPNIYQSQLDSTIYSGILWTVLATTMVYYVFTKL